ncbi:MAG TPA: YbhB/YbcL family Raf kinase inhibitor-like protein, partial [Candidatus Limnocylindria bacterium]|nr:YbhB/YbcL family Raf kinase inhibitor-like protein [Candidatus Limnocylindria bacterium]
MGRRPLAAFLVIIGGLVVGCQPAASPGESVTGSAPGTSGGGSAFTLTSAAFVEGGDIPAVHSCDGAELSPPLEWSGAPDGTVAYALIVHDPDANGYIHWVVGNISATLANFPEGYSTELPEEAAQGVNGTESIGWLGMCPPSGTHSYIFTLYALSEPADVLLGVNATALLEAIDGKVLDQAVLT